jgi:uncharacterized protein YjiS (DUF1127 family)
MMEQGFDSVFRPSSLNVWFDERQRAAPNIPFTGKASHRAKTSRIAPLTAIRRIVAAIRLWRSRARSRQQLRELTDHMLRDIGLRREEVGYEFPKPFSHCD